MIRKSRDRGFMTIKMPFIDWLTTYKKVETEMIVCETFDELQDALREYLRNKYH